MQKRELGRTGLKVFPVGLGAMPLSVEGRPDEETGLKVLRAAFDAGMDFVDTANVYCGNDGDVGHNERLIQKALEACGRVKTVVVATKGGLDRRGPAWPNAASPAFLRTSCEKSLRELKREAITLYQLHAPDPKVPFADSIGELARLKGEGKILHVGLSNVSIAQLNEAQRIVRIESVQNRCNPFDLEDYRDGLLKACEEQGVTYLPYSVVGGHRQHVSAVRDPGLEELGKKYACGPYAVMVAWHLAMSPRVIPIPGASKVGSAQSSASAASLTLAPADIARISALS
ncbi:MAG: aldo/keto reductase [Elusimicrobia bacterium]|nr:aldo/keto reductase [Elusimicrobiota bacterium]